MDFPTQIALNRASLSYSDNQRWERRCGTDHCGLSGRNGHGHGAEKTAAMMIDFFGCFAVVRTGELAADHLGGYDAAEALK